MSDNESRAQQITRVMASMGFTPTPEIDDRYVEFRKDYAEPHGRQARCTILFNKGGILGGMDKARIEGFVITVQGQVAPLVEDITARAPRVMHDDMLTALRDLEGITSHKAEAVEVYDCEGCGVQTPEFALDRQGRKVCPGCLINAIGNDEANGAR